MLANVFSFYELLLCVFIGSLVFRTLFRFLLKCQKNLQIIIPFFSAKSISFDFRPKFRDTRNDWFKQLISIFLNCEQFSRTFCHSAYQPKVEDCYNFELKNWSWVSRNSCVKFRKSKKFQCNIFLTFSFKFQRIFLKQVSTEFRKILEIVGTRKMFANGLVYG